MKTTNNLGIMIQGSFKEDHIKDRLNLYFIKAWEITKLSILKANNFKDLEVKITFRSNSNSNIVWATKI